MKEPENKVHLHHSIFEEAKNGNMMSTFPIHPNALKTKSSFQTRTSMIRFYFWILALIYQNVTMVRQRKPRSWLWERSNLGSFTTWRKIICGGMSGEGISAITKEENIKEPDEKRMGPKSWSSKDGPVCGSIARQWTWDPCPQKLHS
jgi:hypothetical protein